MITKNDLRLVETVSKGRGTLYRYTIGNYTVERFTHPEDYYVNYRVSRDRDKHPYLPTIYIMRGVDKDGNLEGFKVTVSTSSYGDLTTEEMDKFFIQVREGYEVARVLEQVFCGKE